MSKRQLSPIEDSTRHLRQKRANESKSVAEMEPPRTESESQINLARDEQL